MSGRPVQAISWSYRLHLEVRKDVKQLTHLIPTVFRIHDYFDAALLSPGTYPEQIVMKIC